MATLATQQISRAGLASALAAATGAGDKFTPDSRTFLYVKNGGASPITVTVAGQGNEISGLPRGSVVVSVPNAGERMIGPFPGGQFAEASDGLATIAYSGVTSVTVGAFQLPVG